MEFLAIHGPLRQLDHYGKNLSFVQYCLIDVISFVVFLVVLLLILIVYALHRIAQLFIRKMIGVEKEKSN